MSVSIMLDIETWGKHPGCDIRSIGAVVFDPHAGTVTDDTFYVACDNPIGYGYTSKYPLTRDPETVKWWNNQSDAAQGAFENPVDLRDGLIYFAHWLFDQTDEIYNVNEPSHALKLWANGDVSILDAAYRAVGLPVPWHYRAPRSMKTATDLAGLPREEYDTHNALHDAIAQAMTVCKCYERLGLTDGQALRF